MLSENCEIYDKQSKRRTMEFRYILSGPPLEARQPSFGPWLDFEI
jgi:hypothetical protein